MFGLSDGIVLGFKDGAKHGTIRTLNLGQNMIQGKDLYCCLKINLHLT